MSVEQALFVLGGCGEWIGDIYPRESVCLDGHFTIEQLEAVVTVMRECTTYDRTFTRGEICVASA